MTEQEAIKAMQVYSGATQVSAIPLEAVVIAIKALKKQIPQQPARQKDENFGYHEKCPTCGSFGIVKYCCECGQKIDRGGANEQT